MPFFQYKDQVRVYYQVLGDGPALVLLHGFGEDQQIWQPLVEALTGYQIVLVDLPAFGASDRLPEPSIAGFAEAVLAVLGHLGLEPYTLMGHSMGGYVSLAMVEKMPKQVQALGLIHSHPYSDTPKKKEERAKSMEFVRQNGPEPYLKQLYTALFPQAYHQQHPDLVTRLVQKTAPWGTAPILDGLVAMRLRPDRSRVLLDFPRPVLFLSGMEDQVVPLDYRHKQPLLAAQASTHHLEGIGHMAMIEAPEKFVQIIRDFLQTSAALQAEK